MSDWGEKGRRTPVLYSYAYLRKMPDEQVAELVGNPALEVLVDSGAFTALNTGKPVELEDYIEWLLKWEEHLSWYIALDVLGDPAATDANLNVMRDAGLDPVPVHVRGDDERRMDELFESCDYVALGGLRRPQAGPASMQYVGQKMAWAKGRKVHWLGWTNMRAIAHFKPYSVDCSNWASGLRWGYVDLYLGQAEWAPSVDFKRVRDGYRLTLEEQRVVSAAGVPQEWLYDGRRWRHSKAHGVNFTNSVLSILPAHSWVRYADDVRRWWGTRHFLACSVVCPEDIQPQRFATALHKYGRSALEGRLPREFRPPLAAAV